MTRVKTLVLLVALAVGVISATAAAQVDKINVCHLDTVSEIGLTGTVISIPLAAWPAHERHLDYVPIALNPGDFCGIIE